MKPQFPCLTMCSMPGLPSLQGYWWRAEDGVRLLRLLLRPLLVGIAILIVTAALLFGGRSLAPFVIGGGIANPGHLSTMSDKRVSAERDLQAEAARLLASFESSAPANPTSNGELP